LPQKTNNRIIVPRGMLSAATLPYLVITALNDVSDIIVIKLSWYSDLNPIQNVHFRISHFKN